MYCIAWVYNLLAIQWWLHWRSVYKHACVCHVFSMRKSEKTVENYPTFSSWHGKSQGSYSIAVKFHLIHLQAGLNLSLTVGSCPQNEPRQLVSPAGWKTTTAEGAVAFKSSSHRTVIAAAEQSKLLHDFSTLTFNCPCSQCSRYEQFLVLDYFVLSSSSLSSSSSSSLSLYW